MFPRMPFAGGTKILRWGRSYAVPSGVGKPSRAARAGALLAVVGVAAALLTSCSYTLGHRLSPEFGRKPGIFVPVFANETEEIGVERYFTDACLRELRSRGLVMFGERSEGARELRGTVQAITYTATAFTDTGFGGLSTFRRLPTEVGLSVILRFSLFHPNAKEPSWNTTLSGFRRVEVPVDRTYDRQAPSSLGLRTQTTLELRYQEIARDIMRDLYDAMVDLWEERGNG